MGQTGLPAAALGPVNPCNLIPTRSAAGVRPSHAKCVVPAGAWARVFRSCKTDGTALFPFDMAMPAGFSYQPPMVDARNPGAITFVVESDPPLLSLGVNISGKLERKLTAIDYWQQAAWAHLQLDSPAARKAYIDAGLKKVQAVVRQAQKQQAAAARTGSATEQLDGAGGDEAWPVVVQPTPRKPSRPARRIPIQGSEQDTSAAVQVQHVPQHPSSPRGSSAGASSLAGQPAGDSSSQSAAATAPSTGGRRILLLERVPEQAGPGAAAATAPSTGGRRILLQERVPEQAGAGAAAATAPSTGGQRILLQERVPEQAGAGAAAATAPSTGGQRILLQERVPEQAGAGAAAATAPSTGGQHILLQERVPEQAGPGAASADAAEGSTVDPLGGAEPDAAQGALGPGCAELPQGAHGQHLQQSGQASLQPGAAAVGPAPAQHQRQQAVKPQQAGTMAVAEAAEQAAEASSGTAKQPTQAADACQQQPAQADAVAVPDAAIQAAVEATVRAAMAQQMEQVGEALQAMQADTRLTTESLSCQMSALRGEVQQATQAGQDLHSQVARQQEATQQLQQTVRSQVS